MEVRCVLFALLSFNSLVVDGFRVMESDFEGLERADIFGDRSLNLV